MLPAGPLMIEHRLIERMISQISRELDRIKKERTADVVFIDKAVDFIRTYADRCHHGKEEDILFRDLSKKGISDEHKRIMNELIQEHVIGRSTVKSLVQARNAYEEGQEGALDKIIDGFDTLVKFYPKHIEKEDKHFFLEVMDYFNDKEKEAMLDEYREFDRRLIHEKYRNIVEDMEKKEEAPDLPPCERAGTSEHARTFDEDLPCKEQDN